MKGDDFQKRKTKKDKSKRNFELYGKFTPKHIRQQEELQQVQSQRINNNISTNTRNINATNVENNTISKKKKKEKDRK